MGQRIRILVDTIKFAGYHYINWDGCDENGQNVAAGVYICRFKKGNLLGLKKMILLR